MGPLWKHIHSNSEDEESFYGLCMSFSVFFIGNIVLNCNYSQWFYVKVSYKDTYFVHWVFLQCHTCQSAPYQSAFSECPIHLSRVPLVRGLSTFPSVAEVGVIC